MVLLWLDTKKKKRKKMKILFIQRPDSKVKHGGDHSLLLSYKYLLEEKLNLKCDIYHPDTKLETYDYVFFFNIDRPSYYIDLVRLCIKKNINYIIYTLHHPENGIINYLKSGTFGIRKIISLLAYYNPILYEKYLSMIKYKKNYNIREIQKEIISNAKYVLTSSNLESLEIQKDICNGNFLVLPHYYEHKNCNSSKVKNLIVCAGRIEARKNQINILDIAKLNPDKKFIFIGNYNETDKTYIKKFKIKQKNLPNVQIINGLNSVEYYKYLCQADIFISLSYFEVVSLVELDAYTAGCKMIIGKNSYISEFITGNDVIFLKHEELRDLNVHLKELEKISTDRDKKTLYLLSEKNIINILKKIFSKGKLI